MPPRVSLKRMIEPRKHLADSVVEFDNVSSDPPDLYREEDGSIAVVTRVITKQLIKLVTRMSDMSALNGFLLR